MELATRRVHFASSTSNTDEPWILQVSRNFSDAEDGFLREKKYLLMDRDTKFSEAFRVILEESGVPGTIGRHAALLPKCRLICPVQK
jgi:hypothetical protein